MSALYTEFKSSKKLLTRVFNLSLLRSRQSYRGVVRQCSNFPHRSSTLQESGWDLFQILVNDLISQCLMESFYVGALHRIQILKEAPGKDFQPQYTKGQTELQRSCAIVFNFNFQQRSAVVRLGSVPDPCQRSYLAMPHGELLCRRFTQNSNFQRSS